MSIRRKIKVFGKQSSHGVRQLLYTPMSNRPAYFMLWCMPHCKLRRGNWCNRSALQRASNEYVIIQGRFVHVYVLFIENKSTVFFYNARLQSRTLKGNWWDTIPPLMRMFFNAMDVPWKECSVKRRWCPPPLGQSRSAASGYISLKLPVMPIYCTIFHFLIWQ